MHQNVVFWVARILFFGLHLALAISMPTFFDAVGLEIRPFCVRFWCSVVVCSLVRLVGVTVRPLVSPKIPSIVFCVLIVTTGVD